jgi:[NiFe] hydrogenase diaphorase moiety small subunit
LKFVDRGKQRRIAVNAEARLADTDIDATDKAIDVCPVGAILRKRVGYTVTVGERTYDRKPIGTDIETTKE